MVRRALEAAAEQLYQDATDDQRAETTAGQRRADALGVVAESALARRLDPGPASDRYQVVVHVAAGPNPAEPAREADPPRLGTLDPLGPAALNEPGPGVLDEPEGVYVSAETSRRLACDAAHVEMRHAADGPVLDVGRRTRTIPSAIRRALVARDQRCRFPGCSARHCDAHHVKHWANGGATKLTNLVLLCRRHHRAVHEERFGVTLHPDGSVTVTRPDGQVLPNVPPPPRWTGPPLAPTLRRLSDDGITIGPTTAMPRWHGERLDLEWAMSVLWRPQAETEAPL